VVSLASPVHGGSFAEVALVGNEGIVGVPLVRDGSLAMRGICSVSGWADRMDAPGFLRATTGDDLIGELVADYLAALFGQIAQAAACNRLHSTQARLARWLLMSRDRLDSDEFAIAPELLGKLLGSRPATVTLAANTLRTARLIDHQRGRVTIIDRAGLQAVACECYASIKAALDGVTMGSGLRPATGG
jgi:Crp-like helix-turn-helix domain